MNTRYNLVLGTALVAAAALPRPCAAVAFESAETGARRAAPEAKRVGKALAAQGLPSMPYRPREETALATAKFCDVVSQNIYWPLPVPRHGDEPGFPDCPILVGEFHFQARGRGFFNSWSSLTPEERIVAYREYVEHALRDPRFVGTHWFQWGDQIVTGRNDGENFPCGFVDICDRPHEELVKAARDVAVEMCPLRYYGKGR